MEFAPKKHQLWPLWLWVTGDVIVTVQAGSFHLNRHCRDFSMLHCMHILLLSLPIPLPLPPSPGKTSNFSLIHRDEHNNSFMLAQSWSAYKSCRNTHIFRGLIHPKTLCKCAYTHAQYKGVEAQNVSHDKIGTRCIFTSILLCKAGETRGPEAGLQERWYNKRYESQINIMAGK